MGKMSKHIIESQSWDDFFSRPSVVSSDFLQKEPDEPERIIDYKSLLKAINLSINQKKVLHMICLHPSAQPYSYIRLNPDYKLTSETPYGIQPDSGRSVYS